MRARGHKEKIRPIRVLMVYDDPVDVSPYLKLLSAHFSAQAVTTLEEALAETLIDPFDAVVLAKTLAVEDMCHAVYDVAFAGPGHPIVILGHFDEAESATLVACGARGVLDLSTGPQRLVEYITALVTHRDPRVRNRAREARNRALIEAIDAGVIVCSASGRMLQISERAAQLLAEPREKLLNQKFADSLLWEVGPDDPSKERPFEQALRTGKPVGRVDRMRARSGGEARWYERVANPLIREGEERPYAVVISIRDVTEKTQAELGLLSAERRQHLLFEHAAEGYLVFDEEGVIFEASSRVVGLYPSEAVLGRQVLELVHFEDRHILTDALAQLRSEPNKPEHIEVRLVDDAAGEPIWIEATLVNRLAEPVIGGIVVNVRVVSGRKRVLESLAWLSTVVNASPTPILAEKNWLITAWNPACERLFGYTAEEAIGRATLDLIVPTDRVEEVLAARARIANGESSTTPVTMRRHKDGRLVPVRVYSSPIYDSSGKVTGVSMVIRERTERYRLELERRKAENRFRLGFERGAIGMAMLDLDLRLNKVNPALCAMYGRTEAELLGHHVDEFGHPEDPPASPEALSGLLSGNQEVFHRERRFLRKDGSVVWTSIHVTFVADEDESGYLFAQVQDITERKHSEAQLAHQALHDALTGLPNRLLLTDRLSQALKRSGHERGDVAVLFLDVDRFKLVNDGLGHAAGDRLLVDLAARLTAGVRTPDTVARFGGDEFILVYDDVRSLDEARAIGNEVIARLNLPFTVDGKELHVAASCGVVLARPDMTVDEVLSDADAAMYRAKARGGSCAEVFDAALRLEVATRFDLERSLAFAIERGELRVAYQPIVTMDGSRLVGFEALLRWEHASHGLLLPEKFIQIAEASGAIGPIGSHVLSEALRQIALWRRTLPGGDDLWVAVNLSARQLRAADPIALCSKALTEAGVPAAALRLELTESTVMEDVEAAIHWFEGLRRLGVKLAIDDFGTGHSSLSNLSRLPVSSLKIDQSFVAPLGEGDGSAAIVHAIVSLARTLGLELCAEGVETVQQQMHLKNLDCELAQGYFFGRPMWPAELEEWVQNAGLALIA